MKNKLILIAIIFLITANVSTASDFFPETGLDPFNSEINPEFINQSEVATGEFELKKFIKNKIKNRSKNKRQDKQTKINSKEIENANVHNDKESSDESINKDEPENNTFVTTKPKKHLTKAQLERELNKEEREKQSKIEKELKKADNRTLIEKVFNLKSYDLGGAKNRGKDNYEPPENPNIDITANYMEYFPDTYEVHAVGNAKVVFQVQQTK